MLFYKTKVKSRMNSKFKLIHKDNKMAL
jgi:hypothetical protein